MGGLQPRTSSSSRGVGHGKTSLAHQHRLQHRRLLSRRDQAGRLGGKPSPAVLSASSRWKCPAEQLATVSCPSRRKWPPTRCGAATSPRANSQARRRGPEHAGGAALYRRYRRHLHRPARRPRPPPEAPAGLDFMVVDYLQLLTGSFQERLAGAACRKSPRSPPDSRHWQGIARSHHGALPIIASGGIARRQAPATLGPA